MTWMEVSQAICSTEGDVEAKILLPFCELIGYPKTKIFTKVPVLFREGTKGRKSEADIVIAEDDPRETQKGWIVIEAKSPNEKLVSGGFQADSYAHALNVPFYVVANDVQFQIWQKGAFTKSKVVVDIRVADLASNQEEIKTLLSKSSILLYLKQFNIPELRLDSLDSDEYTRQLKEELEVDYFYPRNLKIKDEQKIVAFSGNEDIFNNKNGIVIDSIGGRGKTTLIKAVLGLKRISDSKSTPIYISLNRNSESLIDEIIKKVSIFSPGLVNEASFNSWVKLSNLVIGIDNWEDVKPEQRSYLNNQLKLIEKLNAKFILGKRPSVADPNGDFVFYDLGKYEIDDVDNILKEYLTGKGVEHRIARRIIDAIPESMHQLLEEPIILGKYLDLQVLNGSKISEPPCSLVELMDELIKISLSSREYDLGGKLSEVYSVCGKLASLEAKQFDLEDLANILTLLSISEKASKIIVDYCNIGLCSHLYGDNYTFNHDIWCVYFKYLDIFNAWKHNPIDECLEKIPDIANEDFKLVWPFLVSSVSSPDRQEEFFDKLIKKPPLYLAALRWRSPAVFKDMGNNEIETWCLKQFRSGLYDPLKSWFPSFCKLISPWTELPANYKETPVEYLKYIGAVTEDGVQFATILDEGDAPDVILSLESYKYFSSPKDVMELGRQFCSLSLSGFSKDSGRRYSMRSLFENIISALDDKKLPFTKWGAIEKFMIACYSINHKINKSSIDSVTPNQLKQWAQNEVGKFSSLNNTSSLISYGFSGLNTHVIDEVCSYLISIQYGDTPLREMVLPGPDLKGGGHYSSLYSDKQKTLRIKAYYEAVFDTYIEICEKHMSTFKDFFFYRYFPLNIVISFENNNRGNPLLKSSYRYYYEPTEKASGCRIDSNGINMSSRELIEKVKESFVDKGVIDLSGLVVGYTIGDWSPKEAVITNMVCSMLKEDLEELGDVI